jgi:hypothetical protein
MGNRDPFDGVPYDRVSLGRRSVELPDVTFRPVRNGIDYLLSAVEHLTARRHRDLIVLTALDAPCEDSSPSGEIARGRSEYGYSFHMKGNPQ